MKSSRKSSSSSSSSSVVAISPVGVVGIAAMSAVLVTGLMLLPGSSSSYAQLGIDTPPLAPTEEEQQEQQEQTAGTTTTTNTATDGQMFAIQDSSTSIPDPTPGHEQAHQAVIALPPRGDGRLYTGTVTYTSSHPIEVIVLQQFNQNQTTGGEEDTALPLLTPGQEEAITLIHEFEGDQFDNLNFAGSALSFHSRTNEPFTVTYTIVGELVEPTPLPQQ